MNTQLRTDVMSILLIEDNSADARKIERGFGEVDPECTVTSVRTGMEAMTFIENQLATCPNSLPNLILLDLHLPGMNGVEVLTWLKTQEMTMRIPVLVLSASKDTSDISKAYTAHANAFISKPVGIDALMELVKSIQSFWVATATLWRAEP